MDHITMELIVPKESNTIFALELLFAINDRFKLVHGMQNKIKFEVNLNGFIK